MQSVRKTSVLSSYMGVQSTEGKTWHLPENLIVHESNKSCSWARRQILHVTLDVRRKPWYYVLNFMIPMCMLVAMSMTSFWLPANRIRARLTVSLTSALAAVALKYHIGQTVSVTSQTGHLTLMDAYNNCCYLFLFLTVIKNCAAHALPGIEFFGRWLLIGSFLAGNLIFCMLARSAYSWPSRIAGTKQVRRNVGPNGVGLGWSP